MGKQLLPASIEKLNGQKYPILLTHEAPTPLSNHRAHPSLPFSSSLSPPASASCSWWTPQAFRRDTHLLPRVNCCHHQWPHLRCCLPQLYYFAIVMRSKIRSTTGERRESESHLHKDLMDHDKEGGRCGHRSC